MAIDIRRRRSDLFHVSLIWFGSEYLRKTMGRIPRSESQRHHLLEYRLRIRYWMDPNVVRLNGGRGRSCLDGIHRSVPFLWAQVPLVPSAGRYLSALCRRRILYRIGVSLSHIDILGAGTRYARARVSLHWHICVLNAI